MDPNSVVAYAKGAVAYLAILQELIFLNAAADYQSVITSFAANSAQWLQV